MSTSKTIREQAVIQGMVQGVGFRPHLHRLAEKHGLAGLVRNESNGVRLELEGPPQRITGFWAEFKATKPPLAHISKVTREPLPATGAKGFFIEASRGGGENHILIPPDAGICESCLQELFDPTDRRYEHPFINCTDCGPRYTIIQGLPYDRRLTAMAGFGMCQECDQEYHDPLSRRFHAQPVACHDCGPGLWLCDPGGGRIPGDPLELAVEELKRGGILAVKGIGGFHLAVDAASDDAVQRLRLKKNREQKPLAVMVPDLDAARQLVELDEHERVLLASSPKPIVLAAMKPNSGLAPGIAPGLDRLGVMLAYTPLHHLLLKYGPKALVMTSGNLSGGPICRINQEALDRLGGVAEAFLMHDREIIARADDSVVRVAAGKVQVLRRARGYAPRPLQFLAGGPPVLALGAELKNTVCLAKGDQAFISPHIGDLKDADTLESHQKTTSQLLDLLDLGPQALAVDLHPDYLSTKEAAQYPGLPLVRVQHHAAHALSAMAETGLDMPCIALCLDGAGYGPDGSIWGGEILYVSPQGFKRVGGLRPAPLPGGDMAARQPWRSAAGQLYSILGDGWLESAPPPLRSHIRENTPPGGAQALTTMMHRGFNSPVCSSLGRLFDAAAAIIGLSYETAYEGQAAMELEAIAAKGGGTGYELEIGGPPDQGAEAWIGLDPAPMLGGLLRDVQADTPPAQMAARFHNGLIAALAGATARAAKLHDCTRVILTGGCMMNHILHCGLSRDLTELGLEVVLHGEVPCNDGGISLGQALAARLALAEGDLEMWAKEMP